VILLVDLDDILVNVYTQKVNNEIIISGNDTELHSDIDPEEAQQALERAEANMSRTEGTKELVEAKLAPRRTRIRVKAVNWIPPSN
jgi:F0F1-type ATP synthase epsilon subunit